MVFELRLPVNRCVLLMFIECWRNIGVEAEGFIVDRP